MAGTRIKLLPVYLSLCVSILFALPARSSTLTVGPGGDLQNALNSANPGDVIVITAGATFTGNFTLPAKSNGTATIRVESSALASLPEGRRVSPSSTRYMPTLVSPNSTAVISATTGANNWTFAGLNITTTETVINYGLVTVGLGTETSVGALPANYIFDRCYIHGAAAGNTKRGIALNGVNITVANSWISTIMEVGQDTQALCGWNGPGPYRILNNYLEAAGENVMFGGAEALIPNLIPSQITVENNWFSKPLSWCPFSTQYAGVPWTVKNLLELKNAQAVMVRNNIFQYSWQSGQTGYAILMTPRTNSGQNEWAEVQDVIFSGNVVQHAAGGINFEGVDDDDVEQNVMRLHLVSISDNIFSDINGVPWGGTSTESWVFQVVSGSDHLAITNNTGFSDFGTLIGDGTLSDPSRYFTFTRNICSVGIYGIDGSGSQQGTAALQEYFPGSTVIGNMLIGGDSEIYPPGNTFPANMSAVGFANWQAGNYQLLPGSPYQGMGANVADVVASLRGVNGTSNPLTAPFYAGP